MSSNPWAAPQADLTLPMSDHDRYIHEQVNPMLEAGERIKWTAHLMKAPPLWVQVIFNGLVMLFLIKPYLAAVTNRRIILIRTSHGFAKPKMINKGVEEIRWNAVGELKVGGFANNRSLTFKMNDGTKRTLRIGPWSKFVSGQKGFFEFAQAFDRTKLEA